MSLGSLLDHTCNIYHINKNLNSPGFNLPSSPYFSFSDTPDKSSVSCHFSVRIDGITITQSEPMTTMTARIKLTLPIETDIKLNDKIIDCGNGQEYTAEIPRNIRNHHMTVMLRRTVEQEAL